MPEKLSPIFRINGRPRSIQRIRDDIAKCEKREYDSAAELEDHEKSSPSVRSMSDMDHLCESALISQEDRVDFVRDELKILLEEKEFTEGEVVELQEEIRSLTSEFGILADRLKSALEQLATYRAKARKEKLKVEECKGVHMCVRVCRRAQNQYGRIKEEFHMKIQRLKVLDKASEILHSPDVVRVTRLLREKLPKRKK